MTEGHILFYDGDCGFCNRSVAWILKNERSHRMVFSALNGALAQELELSKLFTGTDWMSSLVYVENGVIYTKSTAALRMVKELKWYWQFLQLGRIIPVCWRDRMYDFIAKRRHRLAGNYCFLPSPEQQKRFLP